MIMALFSFVFHWHDMDDPYIQLTSKHTLHHEGRVGLRDFGLRRELIRCWCYTSDARYNIHIGSGLLNHKSHHH